MERTRRVVARWKIGKLERAPCIFLSRVTFVYRVPSIRTELADNVQRLLIVNISYCKGKAIFSTFSYFGRFHRDNTY